MDNPTHHFHKWVAKIWSKMYRPLPNELTIKNSKIEGLGLFATIKIKKNSLLV